MKKKNILTMLYAEKIQAFSIELYLLGEASDDLLFSALIHNLASQWRVIETS